MSQISEQEPFVEAERAAYLDHWQQFANEQITMEDSPIHPGERARFLAVCADNATRLSSAHEELDKAPSVKAVEQWYGRLGSTNKLEGAGPDLNKALTVTLNSPEATRREDKTMLLGGALAQELGLLSSGKEAEAYFAVASKVYDSVIRKYDRDYNQQIVRQAIAHSFDTTFARLSFGLRDGLISQEDFDTQYFNRHHEYVGMCHKLASDSKINIPNGEMYELYGEVLLRHRLWARERFGDAEVRRALTPREDKPYDNFNHGLKEENSYPLPSYAYDLKLSSIGLEEGPRYLQLKAYDQGIRYAKPVVKVVSYQHSEQLHRHVSEVTGIMIRSYRYETTDREERELEIAFERAGLSSV